MSDLNRHIILKQLDNPPRLLFWDMDEFLFIAVPIFLGMLCNSFLLASCGLLVKFFYSKMKKALPKGTVLHKIYWVLPSVFMEFLADVKKVPASHKRSLFL